MMKKITKKTVIVILGVSLWHSIAINNKYNNVSNEGILAIGIIIGSIITTKKHNEISDKLDIIMEISEKGKIDSLLQEIMDIGWKNDSLTLKYEYGWEF